MAELSKSSFEVKYNDASTGLFKNNTAKDIGADDIRALVTDIKESVPFLLDEAILIYCGAADLSSDLFPTSGGTGASGAIEAGNLFRVSVYGEPGGYPIDVNTEIRALVDSPGQTLANWWIRI